MGLGSVLLTAALWRAAGYLQFGTEAAAFRAAQQLSNGTIQGAFGLQAHVRMQVNRHGQVRA
ncbi:hypothetical protein DL991_32390 [Amycolatopsis sp. WAC 01375]|nr:hypothetical protein DL991_32390 [Amycolatopsis sp. WAC 01375]